MYYLHVDLKAGGTWYFHDDKLQQNRPSRVCRGYARSHSDISYRRGGGGLWDDVDMYA